MDCKNTPLSIYLHIPFCERKCNYCDFLSAPADAQKKKQYVLALLNEITYWGARLKDVPVKSVFLGGGTPSMLEPELIEAILDRLRAEFPGIMKKTGNGKRGRFFLEARETEISMEINPGTVLAEKLEVWRRAGVNRLSIGLQSTDNKELNLLGRIHSYEDFLSTYEMARQCGFDNINIDLMSGLPGQKLESWGNTLKKVIGLEPEHISAYGLIIEEGTPFFEQYHGREELLPDEDTDREMYALTKRLLKAAGYARYEISNYSKAGRECIHNIVYWKRGNYIGMGLGSASMICNVRFKNTETLEDYIQYWRKKENIFHRETFHEKKEWQAEFSDSKNLPEVCQEIQVLTMKEQMEEFMFLGLRMMEGVSVSAFEKLFQQSIFDVYGKQLRSLQEQGLLTIAERIALTDRGIDVSNVVFAQFLFDGTS